MTPLWAQRQAELLRDCIVSPDVFASMVDRLCDFVVPYQHGLETHLNLTVGEGVAQLATLCALEVRVPGQEPFWRVPKPRGTSQRLLEAVGVQLPDVLSQRKGDVVTRTKLPKRRKL